MQSVSGFSPATQAVGLNARQSLANKNRNLLAASGHVDSFQGSQPAAKFAGIMYTDDKKTVKGQALHSALLSRGNRDSSFVPNPKSGRMNQVDGAEYDHLRQIRNDRGLRDHEKIVAIEELFRQFFKPAVR